MRKSNLSITEIKKIVVPILKKNGVVEASIFGSHARGEAKKRSDIDILIRQKGRKSLLDFVQLERELERKLGRKVDLLTYKSIHPYIKKSIYANKIKII